MRMLRRSWVASGLIALAMVCSAGFAAEANVRLEIAPQSLGAALNEFARQSGLQVFLSAEEGAGVTTKKLSGTYTPKIALEKLLSGTGLAYEFLNDRTVAVRQKGQATTPGRDEKAWVKLVGEDMRLAQVVPRAGATVVERESPAEAPPEEPKEITVTGSRIRNAVEDTAHPVATYTQKDLERFGITTLGDLNRLIPQLGASNKTEGSGVSGRRLNGNADVGAADARVTASMRGLGNNTTLILVDGRRLSRSGQASGADNYDFGGIPLSAIDRVEVLSAGASAVYGADAIAGAINIILKKKYSGVDVTTAFDDTFDGGGAVRSMSVSPGFTWGKLSGTAAFSYLEQNQLKATDRWFTATDDKSAWGGRPNPIQLPGGRGAIFTIGPPPPPFPPPPGPNIPGTNSNRAAIPAGSNGVTTTAADYANAGPAPATFDAAQYTNVIDPRRETGTSLRLAYDLGSAAELFLDGRWSQRLNHDIRTAPFLISRITVPVGYPGNPFNFPLSIAKPLFDAPTFLKEREVRLTDWAGSTGLRGELPGDWRYEASAHWTRSKQEDRRYSIDVTRIGQAMNDPNPANRPNVLDDSTTGPSPISDEQYRSWLNVFPSAEMSDNYVYSLQASGSVLTLPSGPVKLALTAEYTDEQARFIANPVDTLSSNARITDGSRSLHSAIGEVLVPLAPEGRLPLLHRLEAGLQARQDTYSDFGSNFTPGYSLLYAPTDWLLLRGSASKGFKVPALADLKGPTRLAGVYILNPLTDPVSGQVLQGPYTATYGANPGMSPERSVSKNFGLVMKAGRMGSLDLRGLTLTVDHFDIDYKDRSISPSPEDIFIFFPERIIRDPVTQLITSFNVSPVNFARLRAQGWDYRVGYDLATRWGDLALQAAWTEPDATRSQAAPGGEVVIQDVPSRATASLFWQRGALEAGLNVHYQSKSGRYNLPNAFWASELGYDPQIAWTFRPETEATSGLSRLLADSRLSLTVFNAIYKDVSIRDAAESEWVVDPRLRRYALSLTKSF